MLHVKARAVSDQFCIEISVYQVTNEKTVHIPVKTADTGTPEPPGLIFQCPTIRACFTSGARPELWLFGNGTAPIETVTGCADLGITSLRLSPMTTGRRSGPALFTSKASPACFRGMPIKTEHAHECGVYENGNKYCVHTVSTCSGQCSMRPSM